MAYQLVAEVLYHAPGTIDGPARLMLVGIAEKVRTGRTVDMARDDLAICAAIKPGSVRKIMRELADLGYDPRVSFGANKNGEPIYAVSGLTPRYRVPDFPAPDGCTCDLCRKAAGGSTEPPANETPGQVGGSVEPPAERLGGSTEPPVSKGAGQVGGPVGPPPQEGGPSEPLRGFSGTPHPSSVLQSQNQIDQTDDVLKTSPAVQLVHRSLTEAGEQPTLAEAKAVLDVVHAIAVKNTGKAAGDGYLDKIAERKGFGAHLATVRAAASQPVPPQDPQNSPVANELKRLRETEPWCGHDIPAGKALHPTHGTPLCPKCRDGIPEPAPDLVNTNDPIAQILAAYGHALHAAGQQRDHFRTIRVRSQAIKLMPDVPLAQLIALAEAAGRNGVDLVTQAQRKEPARAARS